MQLFSGNFLKFSFRSTVPQKFISKLFELLQGQGFKSIQLRSVPSFQQKHPPIFRKPLLDFVPFHRSKKILIAKLFEQLQGQAFKSIQLRSVP